MARNKHGAQRFGAHPGTHLVPSCRRRLSCLWPTLLFVLIGFTPPAATAEPVRDDNAEPSAQLSRQTDLRVILGFNGLCKLGSWTPLTIERRDPNRQAAIRLQARVPDSDSVPTTVATAGAIATDQSRATLLYVRVGQHDADLTLKLFANESPATTHTIAIGDPSSGHSAVTLPATSRLVVAVAAPQALEEALTSQAMEADVATHVARLAAADKLPDKWYAYEGVDSLVLWASDPSRFDTDRLTPTRLEAIDNWVRLGGHLVVVVGERATEVLKQGLPLASLVPGRFVEMKRLRSARAIETFCDGRFPVRLSGGGLDLQVAHLTDLRGPVLAYDLPTDLPLVIRAPHGLGEIRFAAIDFRDATLSEWRGRNDFLRRLVGTDTAEQLAPATSTAGLTSLGYTDLVGQLRAQLDRFEGVRTVGFAEVVVLGLLFIALAGPLDYLLVHKLLRRPVATWLSLPLVMVLTSAAAYAWATHSKGNQFRVNQVEIVDVDVVSGTCRGTIWTGVFAPRSCSLNVAYQPGASVVVDEQGPRSLLGWLGLPGDALGGMQSGEETSLASRGYHFSPELDRAENLPLAVWSSKMLTGRWWAQFNNRLTSQLEDDGIGALRSDVPNVCTITNQLDTALEDCRVFYGRLAYMLGDLPSGSSVDLHDVPKPRSLRNLLTRRNALDEADVPDYDPGGDDLDHLLDMMMWYDTAGGPSFVRLLHRYQAFVDLSNHLEMGRAVLVARVNAPGSQLVDDNGNLPAPRDPKLIYRFILPVTQPRTAAP